MIKYLFKKNKALFYFCKKGLYLKIDAKLKTVTEK